MKNPNQKKTLMRMTSQKAFICGCGKNYSSEPSLYTHEKNKHNGIRQPNTVIPTIKKSIEKSKGRPVSKIFKQNSVASSTNLLQVKIDPQYDNSQQMEQYSYNEYNQKIDSPTTPQESPFSNQYAIQLMHHYFSSKTRKDILDKSSSVHQSSNNVIDELQINKILDFHSQSTLFNLPYLSAIKRLINDFQKLTQFINIEQRQQWIQEFVHLYFNDNNNADQIQLVGNSDVLKILENFKRTQSLI